MTIKFKTESEMCQTFISSVPDTWEVYPETGGFDILLSRKEDGFQVGIEAKLKLNAKVISQAVDDYSHYSVMSPGPDCRAVLIPWSGVGELAALCRFIGIQVIRIEHPDDPDRYAGNRIFHPDLPSIKYGYSEKCGEQWFQFCPQKRIRLPDWIPDTGAGNPSPIMLTPWKVKAIKIAIILEKIGYVTRSDFKYHEISMSRWTQGGMMAWLKSNGMGGWIKTDRLPDFKSQHPKNYDEIESSYNDWALPAAPQQQAEM